MQRVSGRTVRCHTSDAGGGVFEVFTSRSDLIPSVQSPAVQLLERYGIVVLSGCGKLLRKSAEDAIKSYAKVSVKAQPGGWVPIFNGPSAVPMLADDKRQMWHDDQWAGPFAAKVAKELSKAGLLACDPNGPCASKVRSINDVYALRSLPGCRQQPRHADVELAMHYEL